MPSRTTRHTLFPFTALAAATLFLAPSGVALAQDGQGQRIEAVTLSSGGLAEIRWSARVGGAGDLRFDAPLEHVDDILKSLVVRDPGGRVVALTLDGLSPVEETFRRLPFGPDDMNALPALLSSLQGIAISASSGGRTVEGAVLGVETPPGDDQEDAEPILSVMTEAGRITLLRLRPDAEIEILDASMREKVREAAAVSGRGRTDDVRTIALSLDGEGERSVGLDYVVSAPVWKTAYRLAAGPNDTARLQAWAVIENASGADWNGVELTLSSGAPVTLAQRLHERYWHQRQELPVLAQATEQARADRFRGAAATMERSLGVADAVLGTEPPMPAPMEEAKLFSGPAAEALADEGETAATYGLPFPVDLPAGRTLSVPFIDAALPAERIALFQPERAEIHPVSALMLENTTGASLPPGILTVYGEAEGYLGDAELRNVPNGESRMVSFAADRKVEVRSETLPPETIERASLADGVLRLNRLTRQTTVYSVEGAVDAPRTVIVEHPRRDGWRFTSEALDTETPTHHRLRIPVEAGGSARTEARHEQTRTESITLVDADTDSLLHWAGEIDDPQDAATLAEAVERRQSIANAEAELRRIEEEMERAAQNPARIRDNLAAVPDESALGQRYVGMLEAEEDRLAEFMGRRSQAEGELDRLRGQLADFIRAL